MKPTEGAEAQELAAAVTAYEQEFGTLPGLIPEGARRSLVGQIIESQRRNRYFEHLSSVNLSAQRLDPSSDLFDPIRAAILHRRYGQIDEAWWMVFLYTHFGKHRRSGYGYARAVYGALGADQPWTWDRVSTSVSEFRDWLDSNVAGIRALNTPGGFGNHRKYESLDGWSSAGTGSVVESYVDWVGNRGHSARVDAVAASERGLDLFEALYRSIGQVHRFGRTARFDYLMTANRIGLLDASPTHAYLAGATGPLRGARLLFTGSPTGKTSRAELEHGLAQLDGQLALGFDVIEDAICNWQKSPTEFRPFRG